ncbi:ribonuclease P protein subunit p20-like isoform X2 [Schistocerca piceifrons]|uniref:ribonuclease P protein subunit p20-like isoform X2 n=1 Tax=Schistocerca piceifrons TaxID=274613 RepID=UPI001F5F7CF3|nr:ribonuclease P protein subunit p20-like isoform X2 [Schistocerca piceifrons]XP_049782089.1 ribonuclease P protein subunit p20-like isoform X1 [Schistocerca cancellata]XP_049782097.1 ribonuclease P protein subunit p20-like isoform X1 [Schistocerca cancellata]
MADAGVTDVVQWKKRERPKLNNDHVLRKRLPPRLPRRKQDIYITNKSNYKGQLARSEKLLESGEPEIVIHGLGAAVTRAVNLALQLKEKFLGTVELSVNTSTVDIVDDLEPLEDHAEYETNTRQNSSVHIRVFRIALSGANT